MLDFSGFTPPFTWKRIGNEWHGPCPVTGEGADCAWSDGTATLGCRKCGPDGDGRLTGQTFLDHAKALGVLAERRPEDQSWKVRGPDGHEYEHVRVDKGPDDKTVFWRPALKSAGVKLADMSLYAANRLAPGADVVVITEGEKDCDAALRLGLVAVGTVTGAKCTPSDRSLLELIASAPGRIMLWPDADDVGAQHMRNIGRKLRRLDGCPDVLMVDPAALGLTGKGHGAADWRPSDSTDVLDAVLEAAAIYTEPTAPDTAPAQGEAKMDDEPLLDSVWVPASKIQPRPVPWLWQGWLARGEVTVSHGDPSSGKSMTAVDIAAHVTTGRAFPDGKPGLAGDVLWIGHRGEDAADYTIIPRMIAAGANLDRLWLFNAETAVDAELEKVCASAAERKPALAVIDSWAAWGDGGDANDEQGTRARYDHLLPLRKMGVAVLVVAHNRKQRPADGDSPTHSIAGSGQIGAAVRLAFQVAAAGNVTQTKTNIGPPQRPLFFAVEPVTVTVAGADDILSARVVWREPDDTGTDDDGGDPLIVGHGGPTLAEVAGYLMAEPEPRSNSRIAKALNRDNKKGRAAVYRVVREGVKQGALVKGRASIRGQERDVFGVSAASAAICGKPAAAAYREPAASGSPPPTGEPLIAAASAGGQNPEPAAEPQPHILPTLEPDPATVADIERLKAPAAVTGTGDEPGMTEDEGRRRMAAADLRPYVPRAGSSTLTGWTNTADDEARMAQAHAAGHLLLKRGDAWIFFPFGAALARGSRDGRDQGAGRRASEAGAS